MVNDKKLKEETIMEIQKIAEDYSERFQKIIEKEFPLHISELSKNLIVELKSIDEKYRKLRQQGQIEPLEWIYISFLRTGLLDHKPCYRIDFYDNSGCISELECSGEWDFDYVFAFYYQIKNQIISRLKQQTRLMLHDIDDILFRVSENFRVLADDLIVQLLNEIRHYLLELAQGHQLKVMLGEFLDNAKLIESFGVGGENV